MKNPDMKACKAATATVARTREDDINNQLMDPEDSESDKEVARVKIVKNKKSKTRKVNSVNILHKEDSAENDT